MVSTVSTAMNNMIIKDNNKCNDGISFRPVIAAGFAEEHIVQVRCSNDRVKYKAAMEHLGNDVLVWTDELSMSKDYTSVSMFMRSI